MALVIEDGTGVANANSYVTVAQARDYANARGLTLPVDDLVVERQLLLAMGYLESLRFKGLRAQPDLQLLSWPRVGVMHDGVSYPSTSVPTPVRSAQSQLAVELAAGVKLFASTNASSASDRVTTKEKVDVLEVEYASPAETSAAAKSVADLPAVQALLRGLLRGLDLAFAYRG